MSNSRLVSGRVLKKTGADLEESRFQFLDLASAEPDLGTPDFDGAMLISNADGTRFWTSNIRIDLTGNIAVGTISNADGSSAIRMTDNVLIEDNLVVNGFVTAPDLLTSRISSPDSSAVVFTPSVTMNSDFTVDGDAFIGGNLTVYGTTTTINSSELLVEDKNIELARGSESAASSDGAGITVQGPAVPASLTYSADDDTWNFNKTLKSDVIGDVTGRITTTEITSSDSSAISVIPAVIFNSDVIVENEIQGNLVGQVSDISNHSIGELSDVDLDTLPLDNQTLVWDSAQSKFVPGDSFSQTDFDTAFGTKSVGDLSDVDITSNAPTEGQTLVWGSAEGKFVPGRSLGSSDSVDFDTVIANIVTNSIDSEDSSEIVITPSVRMSSDLTVENDLTVSNEARAEKFVGYLDGSARDIESTALTNKQLATELDNNADQIFVYDESAGELKKTYLSEITAFGETGYTGSQGDIGYTGSQGESTFTWGDTAPQNPEIGDRWYDTKRGFLVVYVDDGDSEQWVEVSASGFMGQQGYTGSAGNLSADIDQSTVGRVLINDGTNAQWASGAFMFRNKIINGNFDIWQRGTSQTSSGYGSADRWYNQHSGSTKTAALGFFVPGQTDVPNNPFYFLKHTVTSVAGSSNFVISSQRIEGVRTLAGKTATLSFWAKTDANKNIGVEFLQSFGTGGSPDAFDSFSTQLVALTTSWTKYTITLDIPSISGKTLGTNGDDYLGLLFWFDAGSAYDARSASVGQQSGIFDIAQVQLEEGSAATPFEDRPVGIEGQLCMRYYQFCGSSSATNAVATAYMGTSTSLRFQFPLTVPLRASPSFETVGATITGRYPNSGMTGYTGTTITSLPTGNMGGLDPRCSTSVGYTIAASTGLAGSAAVIAAAGRLYFDAEL